MLWVDADAYMYAWRFSLNFKEPENNWPSVILQMYCRYILCLLDLFDIDQCILKNSHIPSLSKWQIPFDSNARFCLSLSLSVLLKYTSHIKYNLRIYEAKKCDETFTFDSWIPAFGWRLAVEFQARTGRSGVWSHYDVFPARFRLLAWATVFRLQVPVIFGILCIWFETHTTNCFPCHTRKGLRISVGKLKWSHPNSWNKWRLMVF